MMPTPNKTLQPHDRELESSVQRYRYPVSNGDARRKRSCRLGIKARDTRECVGKRVVKWCSSVVLYDNGVPRTLKRMRAWDHMLYSVS